MRGVPRNFTGPVDLFTYSPQFKKHIHGGTVYSLEEAQKIYSQQLDYYHATGRFHGTLPVLEFIEIDIHARRRASLREARAAKAQKAKDRDAGRSQERHPAENLD